MTFTDEQFTATKWATPATKRKFVEHFFKFIKADFERILFKKWFYNELRMIYGHVAHYNLSGFYGCQFSTTEAKIAFLEQTVNPPFGINGEPHNTWSDVEITITNDPRVAEALQAYRVRDAEEIEVRERMELKALQAKYPDA